MTSPSEAKLEILANPESLARRVADWLLAAATVKDGVFAVARSGGSTPQRLHEHLAGPPYRDLFLWSRTHWFWRDERFVPHDDALSNYRMVREALLSRAPIPAINIHPIPTEGVSPEVVPCRVIFGNESYLDKVTITPTNFYRMLSTSEVQPKTSQPAPADFRDACLGAAANMTQLLLLRSPGRSAGLGVRRK